MSSERIGYSISSASLITSGITTGNINFTGSLFQNSVAYVGSQWTSTSGNVSYTSGSVVASTVTANNTIITNSTTGTLNVTGITAGNINFTGSLYQNGIAYNPSTSLKGFQVSGTTGNSFTPLLVAVGSGTNRIAYSTDGITWTGLGTSIFSNGYGVAYSAALSRWVAVGTGTNTIAYSSDGINWTGIGTSIFSSYGYGVAYGGGKWVAVGLGTNSIAYSSDGISWTGLGTSIFSGYGQGVAYNGTNMWVAGGYGTANTIAYSTDGISWTGLGTSIFVSGGWSVAYSSVLSRWVAVGLGTNSIAYSSDGINWTGVTGKSVFSGYGNCVASNGSTSGLIVARQRVQYDTNNNYNNTTGTFTAPSSGLYTINLYGTGNVYITSANNFIPTSGSSYITNAYISAGNTLKCIVSGGTVYNWGVSYL